MAGFVERIGREQSTLFPARLDDYVADDNPVRAVDVFVDGLDIDKLGFMRVQPLDVGRPGTIPGRCLSEHLRLPQSCSVEPPPGTRVPAQHRGVIWLTGQLAPDFKTIADFRKDNGKAIREVCRAFVLLCRKLNLLSEASVAIDGSKFKAVNARDKNFTEAKMKRRLERPPSKRARPHRVGRDHDERRGRAPSRMAGRGPGRTDLARAADRRQGIDRDGLHHYQPRCGRGAARPPARPGARA